MNNLPVSFDHPELIRSAKLPVAYEQARQALARCYEIDECKTWADKASAIASYAKQVDDDTLLNLAKRIKGRAIRQMGLLLRAIAPAKNQHDASARGATSPSSRSQAARDAGLSDDQRKNALRVASIPEQEFEREIEAQAAPSINKLAELGTRKHLEGVDERDHIVGTTLIGLVRHITRQSATFDLERGVRGVKPSELAELIEHLHAAKAVLERIGLLLQRRQQACIQADNSQPKFKTASPI
jgi:hypothetical protein